MDGRDTDPRTSVGCSRAVLALQRKGTENVCDAMTIPSTNDSQETL